MNELNIKIIERETIRGGWATPFDFRVARSINKKNSRMILGKDLCEALGLKVGQEVLVGRVGSHFYVGVDTERPPRYKGYILRNTKSGRAPMQIANKILYNQLPQGDYIMGDEILKDKVLWREVVPRDS